MVRGKDGKLYMLEIGDGETETIRFRVDWDGYPGEYDRHAARRARD